MLYKPNCDLKCNKSKSCLNLRSYCCYVTNLRQYGVQIFRELPLWPCETLQWILVWNYVLISWGDMLYKPNCNLKCNKSKSCLNLRSYCCYVTNLWQYVVHIWTCETLQWTFVWNYVLTYFIISWLYFDKLNSKNQQLYKQPYKVSILGQWKQKVCLKHLFNLVAVLSGV